jgi:hypothetical protein
MKLKKILSIYNIKHVLIYTIGVFLLVFLDQDLTLKETIGSKEYIGFFIIMFLSLASVFANNYNNLKSIPQ